MKVERTSLAGVLILQPEVFGDARGFFLESWNQRAFARATGVDVNFVQDNHSHSDKGVLRGLHYQVRQPQGKLVRVVRGTIFDVVVDIRRNSPTFGRWIGAMLSADDQRQLWMPTGLAHGFLVLADATDVLYKTTNYYAPEHARCIAWNDADLAIDWPLAAHDIAAPLLSAADRAAPRLSEAELPD